ncbi:Acyl-protein thioesterase 1 [Elsinoe australis]|uniref:Crh-like protein n=1 Tax=Elsinoe australis TaxID=40998 RepID=A0A2P8A5L8_9PEZI|nr:Acyl-protein thioesterase 1 [Elsinoe australis]
MYFTVAALAALAAIPTTFGQTFTDCNPLEKTCPADNGLESTSFYSDFTKGKADGWSAAAGTTMNYGAQGAEFTIAREGNAPTIETDFHILFGTIEVKMQASAGTGIISSIVLESADLDEIDWEFTGTDTAHAQSNYFGKGNTTSYDRVAYLPVSPPPQTSMHTYTLNWTPTQLTYSIDGVQMRVLNAADANGGSNYPQTPMKLKLGNWAGGAPNSPIGTVEWAGGRTDYSQAPFTMIVESVKITNMYPAKEYIWTDNSGSWQSIQVVGSNGVSRVASNGNSAGSSPSATTAAATTTEQAKATTSQAADTPVKKMATANYSDVSSSFTTPAVAAATTATSTTSSTKTEPTSSTKADSTSSTKTGTQSKEASATATGHSGNATKPESHANNKTSTLTTTTKASEATAAIRNGNSTSTTGSGSRIGNATTATISPARQTGAASSNSAMSGLILIFTLSMCFMML